MSFEKSGRLSADELIAAAEQQAGLSDWGEDDFRTPLAALVESAEEEACLSTIGRERLRKWVTLRLEQRLKMIEDRKRLPVIAEQAIDRPVFIMGLPRAGTTYLHKLMGLHPDMLTPLFWQLFLTSPPPHDPAIDHSSEIARMNAFMGEQGWYAPEIARAHIHHPEEPEEDIFAFEYSMVSMYFTGYLDVPSYLQYIFGRGFDDSFLWHKRFLQALQYGTQDKRFMLKAPGYTLYTQQLLQHYPDAVLIQNHRDPSKVMASVFSTMSATRGTMSDRPQQITRDQAIEFMTMYAQGLVTAAEQRSQPSVAGRFADIHYLNLERDPLGCVRRASAHAGIAFGPDEEARIVDWAATNRKGKHGKHQYALADYGLTQRDVHAVFADYIERFDVEREDGA